MTRPTAICLATTLALLAFSGSAFASATPPSPLADSEVNYLEAKQRAFSPAAMETAPIPVGAAEYESLARMEAASGIDGDSIRAGTSLVDLILLVLLVYLVLRILD